MNMIQICYNKIRRNIQQTLRIVHYPITLQSLFLIKGGGVLLYLYILFVCLGDNVDAILMRKSCAMCVASQLLLLLVAPVAAAMR